jgi:hypothetical protein
LFLFLPRTLTRQVSISRKSNSLEFLKEFVASWCMSLYRPKAGITHTMATCMIMLPYVIGPVMDKARCVLFMTILSTTSINVRCMDFYYCHIKIGVWTSVIIILLYIYVMFNEMCAWMWFGPNFWIVCMNIVLSSSDGWANVSSPVAAVQVVATGG